MRVPARGTSTGASMPYQIAVNTDKRRFEITYTGAVTIEQRHEALEQVFAAAATTGFRRILVDFRQGNPSADEFDPSNRFATFLARNTGGFDARSAYLTRTTLPINRTVEILAAARGVPCKRFTDEAEAIAWLEGGVAPLVTP